jgi:hypothetical protein
MSTDHPLRKEFEAYILRDRGTDYLLRNDPSIDAEHDYVDPFVQEAWEAWQAARQPTPSFQDRVHPWMLQCFGEEIAADQVERNHRFVEEALELAQACGCTRSEAEQLLTYVFDRPAGERKQEVGGVMVTLAALCTAHGINMEEAGEKELARVWTKVEVIRAKQVAKPKHSPLPGPSLSP